MDIQKKYSDNEIANLLDQNSKLIQSLSNQLEEHKLELATWKRVTDSDDWFEMASVAKVLNYEGYGRNKIFEFLRDSKILRHNNEPYQSYVDKGYFKLIEQEVTLPFGNTMINRKTVISQKGVDYIRKLLDEKENDNEQKSDN